GRAGAGRPTRARRPTGSGFKRAATAEEGPGRASRPGGGVSRGRGSSRRRRRGRGPGGWSGPRARPAAEPGAGRPAHPAVGPDDVYRPVAAPGGPPHPPPITQGDGTGGVGAVRAVLPPCPGFRPPFFSPSGRLGVPGRRP